MNVATQKPLRSHQPLKVINLFGAPGTGKSAAAGGLYEEMKFHHQSVEMSREYAKYLIIAGREWQREEEQLYLFAKQHHELFILRGQYEFAITDSPLPLTAFYANPTVTPKEFYPCVRAYFETFQNINYFLERDFKDPSQVFEDRGRVHNREQSIQNMTEQRRFLENQNIPYTLISMTPGVRPHQLIFEDLRKRGLLSC